MTSSTPPPPHVALFPSAGMGHLLPFLRLAATLNSRGCHVTLITAEPTVSISESSHISAFLRSNPKINHHSLHVQPLDSSTDISDPFFKQFEAIRRSLHLVTPLLKSTSPPVTSIVTDITVSASMAEAVSELDIPSYVLCTTSAKFFSLICRLPVLISDPVNFEAEEIQIPGVAPIAKSSIPPPFSIPGHFFVKELLANATSFPKFKGILINSFTEFETQTLKALNDGKVMHGLPPVLPIGPLPAFDYPVKEVNEESQCRILQWLDTQPNRSVIYLSFGSRTALPVDQITEIAKALEICSYRFVWILKLSKVDKEDREDLVDILGQTFLNNVKNRGIVIKEWVDQEKILSHSATGGFVSHCGWNSIMEAAERGVPVVAWPLSGDQRVNAEVVVDAGLGVWDRSWSGQRVVEAEEIVKKVAEVMDGGEMIMRRAELVRVEAMRAVGDGGSSDANYVKAFF
ncbi:unnamed protein product [Rhodiola kirilowii]